MRVGIVLSGLAPADVDSRLLEVAAALGASHDVELWAPPGARAHLSRRLPAGVAVHHADAVEGRAASRRLRPRKPRALRRDGLPGPRLDAVLQRIDAHLVIVPTARDAQRARRELPSRTLVIAWSPARELLSGPRAAAACSPRVLAAGDLVASSRFGDAMRAFDAATTAGDGWTMHVRGAGRHANALADLVAWRSLQDRVDIAPLDSWATELSGAGLLAATSPHATPGLQALAAAASGIPVVGFDDDPVASAVAAAGGGYVVPSGSVAALGAVMRHLVADADAWERCAQRARAFASGLDAGSDAATWVALVDAIAADQASRREHAAPAAALSGAQGAPSRAKVASTASLAAAVRTVMADAGVPHARIGTTEGGEAIVVAAEHRQAVVRALLRDGDLPAGPVVPFVHGEPAAATHALSSATLENLLPVVDQLRVLSASTDAETFVDVELWAADADGLRRAPRRNRETDAVGPASWQAWMAQSGGTVTGLPLWDQITFPIDAVFTWVDGADERWRAQRDAHAAPSTAQAPHAGAEEERFLSRDEIYYAVAAARQRMPWLRRIIIVTDSQRHERIAREFPEVEFVDHREIFPDAAVLPVFNSHAIEASLHRIPGLAEHFVYLNDDMIVARPLAPTDLFDANGVATFFPSPLTIGFHDDLEAEPHLLAAARNRRLLAHDFGVEIAHSMLHTPYAHRRSVLEEMDARYGEEFARTRASRFRSGEDVSVLSSFAQHYGWLTQRYRPGNVQYRFVRLDAGALRERLDAVLADDSVQVVALGEPLPGQERHPEERRLVTEFLEALTA